MNKPYFTKYIPVEGEIKEGDWFQVLGKPLPIGVLTLRYTEDFDKGTPNMQKVKLFLCSRDIQVGDKVFLLNDVELDNGNESVLVSTNDELKVLDDKQPGEENISLKIEKLFGTGRSGMVVKPEEIYKVIGEVSPNAIWVKEGMEFEEDDVRRVVVTEFKFVPQFCEDEYQYYNPKLDEKFVVPKNERLVREHPIEFKCSQCNTFH